MFDNAKILLTLAFLAFLALPQKKAQSHHASCEAVHAAAYMDEPQELMELVDHNADLNCLDSLFQTPLITAVDGASIDIVKILLQKKVALDYRDELGETALAKARRKLAFFDMNGGENYRQLYLVLIKMLERAGAED